MENGGGRNVVESEGDIPFPTSSHRPAVTLSCKQREGTGSEGPRGEASACHEKRHDEEHRGAYAATFSHYDEHDLLLSDMEFAIDQAQFKHLQALEDSVNEAAWSAHLAVRTPGSEAILGAMR